MLLLDAVNYMMPKLGEHEVTSIEARHPTVALILPAIEDTLRIVLGKGWWFNEFNATLYPDSENELNLGTNVINVVPYQPSTAVQRGRRMYNPETFSYKFDSPINVRIRQYVDFEEIPEPAAVWVRNEALSQVYTADIGVTQDIQVWMALAEQAKSDLLAEHLRNKRYTTKNSRPFRKLRSALKGN